VHTARVRASDIHLTTHPDRWLGLAVHVPPGELPAARRFASRASGTTRAASASSVRGGRERPTPGTFAWPMEGGAATWSAEVAARLAAIGRDTDHALLAGVVRARAVAMGRRID